LRAKPILASVMICRQGVIVRGIYREKQGILTGSADWDGIRIMRLPSETASRRGLGVIELRQPISN